MQVAITARMTAKPKSIPTSWRYYIFVGGR
jgi:hypothetical protein